MIASNRTRRSAAIAAVAVLAGWSFAVGAASPAAAEDLTFVVNSTGDAGAAGSTSDGVCDTGGTVAGEPECTLRAAIQEANGTPGADAVDATSTSGVVQLGSPLLITSDVQIAGPGAHLLTVRGGGVDGGFRVFTLQPAFEEATISGLTVAHGAVAAGTTIDAGGILNFSDGRLTLDGVAVVENTFGGGSAGAAGVASTGELVIEHSTIAGNTATGSFIFGRAGALAMGNDAGLEIRNSTIGDNHISGGVSGSGGIRTNGTVSLDSVTFAGNTADTGGTPALDLWVGPGTPVDVVNTIFGSSGTAAPCVALSGLTSLGHNLEAGSTGSCGLAQATDLNGEDPGLDPLGLVGGTTPTYPLTADSPARDAGGTDLTTDQRGTARPSGSADDIGAFEFVEPLDSIALTPASSEVVAGSTVEYSVEGFDESGTSLGDRTDDAGWAIDPDAGAVPSGSAVTFTAAGEYTVTATVDGRSATATVSVGPAALASLEVAPADATAIVGDLVDYAVTGYDAYGNSIGDLTGSAQFASTVDGAEVSGATIRFDSIGSGFVTATVGAISGSTTVAVEAGAVTSIELELSATTVDVGDSVDATVAGLNANGIVIDDMTAEARITSDHPSDLVEENTITFPSASPHVITAAVGELRDTAVVEVRPAGLAASGVEGWIGLLGAATLLVGGVLAVTGSRRAIGG